MGYEVVEYSTPTVDATLVVVLLFEKVVGAVRRSVHEPVCYGLELERIRCPIGRIARGELRIENDVTIGDGGTRHRRDGGICL